MIVSAVFVLILFALACIWFAAWAIGLYNSLVSVRVNVDSAWSNIDVLLKERHDELGKMLDAVAAYTGYEQGTLKDVTELRDRTGSGDGSDRMNAENALTNGIPKLLAVAENYPELHASQSFGNLQAAIAELETQIAHRREYYNAAVNVNNARLAQFPDSLLAPVAGLRQRDMFVASDDDRADVNVGAALQQVQQTA